MANIMKRIRTYFLPPEKKIKKNVYITCSGRDDGLGAQLHSYLSVLLVAEQYGLKYVHTPFSILDHNNGKEETYENFFGIGNNELNITELDQKDLKKEIIKHSYEIKNNTNILYSTQSCHDYGNKYPDFYLKIRNKFKKNFFYKFKDDYLNYNDKNYLNIGLHIRRGDVSNQINKVRFTNNDYYIKIVDEILELTKSLNIKIKIHIYSQGSLKDFKEFERYNSFYHLDECLLKTFYNLIESDILVMSKSSLSYSAALLCENIVLYQPFWHNKLSTWNEVKIKNEDNLLNKNELLNKINFLWKEIK
jgi:hypothetical protein